MGLDRMIDILHNQATWNLSGEMLCILMVGLLGIVIFIIKSIKGRITRQVIILYVYRCIDFINKMYLFLEV